MVHRRREVDLILGVVVSFERLDENGLTAERDERRAEALKCERGEPVLVVSLVGHAPIPSVMHPFHRLDMPDDTRERSYC